MAGGGKDIQEMYSIYAGIDIRSASCGNKEKRTV